MRRPSHGTVVAYLALTLAMSGTAYAATGGTFILGQTNKANRPSKLVNTKSGPALTLRSQPGSAPLLPVCRKTPFGLPLRGATLVCDGSDDPFTAVPTVAVYAQPLTSTGKRTL